VTLLALPDGAIALGLGAALAVGAAAVVLVPLWRTAEGAPAVDPADRAAPDTLATRIAERASAVDALREIEFDRATGKLSDTDYSTLKATYTRRALAELRARDAAGAAVAVGDDAVEAAIRRYRSHATSCAACGPRPEPDALFCSSCGRFLAGRCARCGAACEAAGQRFCGECGHTLAG
jgi:hypothetical protein